jgi:hypothetical protein
MARMAAVAVAAFLALGQEAGGPDRVVLFTGEEVRGELVDVTVDGTLVVRQGAVKRFVPMEEATRILFEEKPLIAAEKGEKVWHRLGGVMTGTVEGIADGRVRVRTSHGSYSLVRAEVRFVALTPTGGWTPGAKEETTDCILRAPPGAKSSEWRAEPGKVESMDAERVRLDGKEVPRAEVRMVRFFMGAAPAVPMGWFARVLFKNGDGLAGTLRKVERTKVHLFSHAAGAAVIDKKAIHSIAFGTAPRMRSGYMMVCDQAGVKELDREGRVVWSYTENASSCWAARKLPSGNVLIANSQNGQVVEVRPTSATGGEIVQQIDGLSYPSDAQRLENGNTLVAEYQANKVAEYDARDRAVKWSAGVGQPTSAERLEDGTTLVCTQQQAVVELSPKGAEMVRWTVAGVRPWRATRLPGGTTLITDMSGHQVVEIDRQGSVVWTWKKEGVVHPYQAVRMDDGNTLILVFRQGHILEVDPQGAEVRRIPGFTNPYNLTVH